MEHLNETASRILDRLTEGMGGGRKEQHRRYGEKGGAFMPVVVEYVGHRSGRPVFSVAHYHVVNSDPCRDPEMELFLGADGEWYPVSYWLDIPPFGEPIREDSVAWDEFGHIAGFYPEANRRQVEFANMWMVNIKEQQGLEV